MDRLVDSRQSRKKQRTKFVSEFSSEMAYFAPQSTSQFLNPPSAPSRKRSQRFIRTHNEVDDFLSSDLEASFASTVSLYSPPHEPLALTPDSEYAEPMDISPAPAPKPTASRLSGIERDYSLKPHARPRAYTSAARLFGNDISNGLLPSPSMAPVPSLKSAGSTYSKKTQRAALPTEWLMTAPTPEQPKQAVSPQSVSKSEVRNLTRHLLFCFHVSLPKNLLLLLTMPWT